MASIEVLDQITIDKIAAGEVVERPFSVVKELTENAIDAGADAITVEIKDGGKELIRITDNGSGIEKDMVARAFLRHSTSKIRNIRDLESISSLGFRGEALSSISAVAQVELMTKTKDDFTGIRYVIEGGREISKEEIGVPEGTTILVKNLFFNTPAREKFLKTGQTEGNYVNSLMEQMALSHPDISFQFISNGTVKLQTPGNGNRKDVIYQIYGRDITNNLLEVHLEHEHYKVTGFVGKPVVSRGNRNFECYYVNGRYVKNNIIARGIEDAYKKYMMQHQFPFAMLYFEIDGSYVDVNVHPAKMEVRFSAGNEMYQFVYVAVSEALKKKEFIPEAVIEKKPKEAPLPVKEPAIAPQPFEKKKMEQLREAIRKDTPYEPKYEKPLVRETVNFIDAKPEATQVHKPSAEETVKKEEAQPVVTEYVQETLDYKKTETAYFKLIGQLFQTYWIVEYDKKMYMVDQHAAHEKINYERMMKRFRENSFSSQMIHPPLILTLSAGEEALLEKHKSTFEKFGFEIEPFGGKEYAISAVPSELFGMDAKQFFVELLDEFTGFSSEKETPEVIEAKLATAACKASVKGNDKLSAAEAQQLLKELFELENPYHCPHGRPTMISMSKQEIEKKFKRIV